MARRKGQPSALVEFDHRATARSITIASRNAAGRFTKVQGVILKANRRSIAWLAEEASANLSKSITAHGRPQEYNSGRLKRAIEDLSNSSANVDGFAFMRDDKVRKEVPYYRAIERGSRYWVNRYLPFAFLGGDSGPSHLVGPREYRSLGYAGPREVLKIRNPVPRYGYASKARRVFLSQNIYATFVNEEKREFEAATGAILTVS